MKEMVMLSKMFNKGLLVLFLLLSFSGCFKKDEAKNESVLRSDSNCFGVEYKLDHKINEKDVTVSNGILKIVKWNGTQTILSLASSKEIAKGTEIAKIKIAEGYRIEKITEVKNISISSEIKRVEVPLRLLGDFDNDGAVTINDFIVFSSAYGTEKAPGVVQWILGDIAPATKGTGSWSEIYCNNTPDGKVSIDDFIVFAANYGKKIPSNDSIIICFSKFSWAKVFIRYSIDNGPWLTEEMKEGIIYKDTNQFSCRGQNLKFSFFDDTGAISDSSGVPFEVTPGIYKTYCNVSFAYNVTDIKPMNLTIAGLGAKTVKIKWDQNEGAEGYRILRSDQRDGVYSEILKLERGMTNFGETNLEKGKKYYYKVIAFRGSVSTYQEVTSDVIEVETKNIALSRKGVFKIANSYGIGKNDWETSMDGFFYITYDLATQSKLDVAVMEKPTKKYIPKVFAVFEIDGGSMNYYDMSIDIGIGNPDSPLKIKTFNKNDAFYSGSPAFPKNSIAFDITELLPVLNQSIFLRVNHTKVATGTIKSFKIEVYDEATGKTLMNQYQANDLPKQIIISGKTDSIIQNITIDLPAIIKRGMNEKSTLERLSRKCTAEEIMNGKIFKGNGIFADNKKSGYIPFSESMKNSAFENGSIRKLDSALLKNNSKRAATTRVDNSQSEYFPPIAFQEDGTCTAWSVAYYTGTYYNALINGWNVKNAKWEDRTISAEYRNKIMSPDFVYHLVNGGGDNGSSFQAAMWVASEIGMATFDTMAYTPKDQTTMPEEKAWREAAQHRVNSTINLGIFYIQTMSDVEVVKELLRNGYLVSVGINSGGLSDKQNTTINDVFYKKPATDRLDHAVTIVGYDDEFEVEE